jgi:hypothetical protein
MEGGRVEPERRLERQQFTKAALLVQSRRLYWYRGLPPLLVQRLPPLLVQRLSFYWYRGCCLYWYRGTTAGLGYLEVYWNCPCKFFSLGGWLVSALSTPNDNGGEGYNSSADLNSNTITTIQLQCIQASRPHLQANPNLKYCMSQSSQPPYCTVPTSMK